MKNIGAVSTARKVFIALFWIYIGVLLVMVVLKFNGSITDLLRRIDFYRTSREYGYYRVNFVPFTSIISQFNLIHERWAYVNLVGNIIVFLPLGFLPPFAYPAAFGRAWKTLLFALGTVICIEGLQFLLMLGSCDIDDVILNMLAAVIGYAGYYTYHRIKQHRKKAITD